MAYINNEEFVFELIVSKARGKVSDRLHEMFWLISVNLKNKPPFNHIPEFNDDQIMEAYCMMLETWSGVEVEKYNSASIFAYFTERAKRSYVKIFNIYMDRKQYQNNYEAPRKIRLSETFNM